MNVPPEAPPRPPDDRPAATRPHRLVREPDDRRIAGVCAGLADRFGVDVSLVRLAAVALAVFTPFGLVGYLVAWVIVPRRQPDEPRVVAPAADLHQVHGVPLWLLVVGAAALAFAAADGLWWWRPSAPVLAVALVVLGTWLLARGREDDDMPPPAPPEGLSAPEPPNVSTLGGRSTTVDADLSPPLAAGVGAGPPGEVPPPASPRWSGAGTEAADAWAERDLPATAAGSAVPAEPAEPADRSGVVLAVVALLLIGGGMAWLLYVLDVATLPIRDGLAAGLVVVGGGLVVAAWRGRAWSLAVIGLLFASALLLAEAIDAPLDAGAGERRVVVDSRRELADTHELFAGKLTLDLRRAPLSVTGPASLEAAVGIGTLHVIVPSDANVDVDARVKVGNVAGELTPSPDEGGVNLHESFTVVGREGGPDLDLDLQVGIGELVVSRDRAGGRP